MSQSIEQLYAALNNKFIEQRTLTEVELNKFLKSLEGLDPVYQQELGFVAGRTARDMIPSLWVEPFDEAMYLQEKAIVDDLVSRSVTLCNKLNEEALRCLQE